MAFRVEASSASRPLSRLSCSCTWARQLCAHAHAQAQRPHARSRRVGSNKGQPGCRLRPMRAQRQGKSACWAACAAHHWHRSGTRRAQHLFSPHLVSVLEQQLQVVDAVVLVLELRVRVVHAGLPRVQLLPLGLRRRVQPVPARVERRHLLLGLDPAGSTRGRHVRWPRSRLRSGCAPSSLLTAARQGRRCRSLRWRGAPTTVPPSRQEQRACPTSCPTSTCTHAPLELRREQGVPLERRGGRRRGQLRQVV